MRLPAKRQTRPVRRCLQASAPIALTGSRRTTASFLPLFCFCLGNLLWAAEVPLKDQPHLRRPVAGAWLVESKLLAVANQRSGSLSIVDIKKCMVLAEVVVGERLADVAALPSDGWLLAVDEKRHELLVLQWEAGELQIVERIPVSRYPVNIADFTRRLALHGCFAVVANDHNFWNKARRGDSVAHTHQAERVDAELRAERAALSAGRRARSRGRRVYRPNGPARRCCATCGQILRQAHSPESMEWR